MVLQKLSQLEPLTALKAKAYDECLKNEKVLEKVERQILKVGKDFSDLVKDLFAIVEAMIIESRTPW